MVATKISSSKHCNIATALFPWNHQIYGSRKHESKILRDLLRKGQEVISGMPSKGSHFLKFHDTDWKNGHKNCLAPVSESQIYHLRISGSAILTGRFGGCLTFLSSEVLHLVSKFLVCEHNIFTIFWRIRSSPGHKKETYYYMSRFMKVGKEFYPFRF